MAGLSIKEFLMLNRARHDIELGRWVLIFPYLCAAPVVDPRSVLSENR